MAKAFFYGLLLDLDILIELGLSPQNIQRAKLENYDLVIGERANLIEKHNSDVWGNLIDLKEEELKKLYSEKSVADYQPKIVSCVVGNNKNESAVTYILPAGYKMNVAKNSDYAEKLLTVCKKYDFPESYLKRINEIIDEIGKN